MFFEVTIDGSLPAGKRYVHRAVPPGAVAIAAQAGGRREPAGERAGAEGKAGEALTPVGRKPGKRIPGRGRFPQFRMDAADLEERRAHLWRGKLLARSAAQSWRLFINGCGHGERANGDAKVVDLLNHFSWVLP